MAVIEMPAGHRSADPPRRPRAVSLVSTDRWAGWRDGRRGLPQVRGSTDGPRIEPSGHLLSTWAAASQRIDTRFRELLAQTADDRVELAGSRPRRAVLRLRVEEHERRLAVLREQGPDPDRRMGEAALPDSQVQRRRRAEFARQLRRLRKQVTEARNELADLESRQLHLAARIEVSLDAAQGDARVLTVNGDRRVASYLKGACRTHPDPSAIVAASAALRRPDPDWMSVTNAHDLMNLLNGGTR